MNRTLNYIFDKSRILIVDDDEINREILTLILGNNFDLVYASNGLEAMNIIDNDENIQLVLLDILMPVMDGFTVMEILKKRGLIGKLPIIVLTSEKEFEVKCLKMGADDFIRKPFDLPEVILARVQRIIELYEDKNLISSIDIDPLSKLFTVDFFIRYAKKYRKPIDNKMDMLYLNVDHFHIINEMSGRVVGDHIIEAIGRTIIDYFSSYKALATRNNGDNYYIYLPHQPSYEAFLKQLNGVIGEISDNAIKFRLGVYSSNAKEKVEDMISKAKVAGDTLRGNYNRNIAYYDDELHEKRIYNQRLVNDFHNALINHEFKVYVQPKYCIDKDVPFLAGGEALIRWVSPELGFISPGIFIPLFEENGLIRALDYYVFEETVKYIKELNDKLDVHIPLSVNVSRVDVFDDELETRLLDLINKYHINIKELHLEITESAYTNDSRVIVEVVKSLRDKGFVIEMDDFGSGYSSLNMLSELPIDILKIDIGFIKRMMISPREEEMVSFIIKLAKHLGVLATAEGVENIEQVNKLKEFGCNYIQGFYFSKPLTLAEFFEKAERELK